MSQIIQNKKSVILFFFFKQKTAYEIMPSLVGSEMCIRDRQQPYGKQRIKYGFKSLSNTPSEDKNQSNQFDTEETFSASIKNHSAQPNRSSLLRQQNLPLRCQVILQPQSSIKTCLLCWKIITKGRRISSLIFSTQVKSASTVFSLYVFGFQFPRDLRLIDSLLLINNINVVCQQMQSYMPNLHIMYSYLCEVLRYRNPSSLYITQGENCFSYNQSVGFFRLFFLLNKVFDKLNKFCVLFCMFPSFDTILPSLLPFACFHHYCDFACCVSLYYKD
eukprot:TRINITY_DN4163_c0_g2_i2.p1 TRINITY_DN4163_c0_g2~~TRINITY_DN4163_c0_g2_i2.p1  ORF type:complete len:275 (-),score=-34.91 TRINITY_DN4163_c0_g2_i2:270-1094(-)